MIRRVWQGLWERKARTALTFLGVAACVLALTSVDGMLGHMRFESLLDVERFESKLLLQPAGAEFPPFKNVLPEDAITAAFEINDVAAMQSSPLLFVVLAPPNNPMDAAGVIGLGLWPNHERSWLSDSSFAAGVTTLTKQGDDAVILGSEAQRHYGLSSVGESIEFAGRNWQVVGLLQETGMTNIDNLVLMPLESAQAAFDLQGWISAVLLTAEQGRAEALGGALAAKYPALEVYDQKDIEQVLRTRLDMPNKFLGLVSWAALVIATVIVANVMIIAVRERSQELALLRAIGERRSAILGHTFAEALVLSLAGGALGVLASVPTARSLGWEWILTWGEMGRVGMMVLWAGIVAGAYPAYRAARVYPQALHVDELRRQIEEVSAEKHAIDQAYRHQVRAREQERERLARELHDRAIQSMLGLKFRLAELNPSAQDELQAKINEVIDGLREMCADLRPPALDRLGLVASLRSHVDDFSERTKLPVGFSVQGEDQRLRPEVELSLFRVAQEALSNAWKHAQTPTIEIELTFCNENVTLLVHDHGRGFDVPMRMRLLAESGHFGLVGMQERLELVGGSLHVSSRPGQGTVIEARVPRSLR